MASQTKIKALRSLPTRLSKNAPAAIGSTRRLPKSPVSNPLHQGLRSSSRPRNSQLPVPVVNKTNTMTRNKTVSDRNLLSSSKDKGQSRNQSHTGNAVTHPNIAKLLVSHTNQDNDLPGSADSRNIATQPSISTPTTPRSEDSPQDISHDKVESALKDTSIQADPSTPNSPTEEPSESNSTTCADNPDNTATNTPGSNLPPSVPTDPWHLAYSEMKTMALELRSVSLKMSQLDKIEKDVVSLRTQIEGISAKTKDLETAIQIHSTDINAIRSSLADTTSNVDQNDASLEKLWAFSEEVASKADQRIHEIKQAIQENIDKIEQIGDVKAAINQEVTTQIKDILQVFKQEFKRECGEQMKRNAQATKTELYTVINRNAHDFAYRNLQDQAFFNRHNLVLRGISESGRESAFTQASNFFTSKMNLSNLSIDVAYRLGKPLVHDSSYDRPIVVKFSKISDRNTVWKKRNNISQQGRGKSVRIQPDVPKQLREDLQILYRVQNAAQKTNQYRTVEVRNYRLYLDGSEYFAWELEHLPDTLRPSYLATRTSDDALIFYSKHTPLSNHHASPFEVRGRTYANMEQYLAYRKAKLSGQKHLIQKALLAQDPVEAKSILHALRSDHQEEWKQEVSSIAEEGLQAKFRQHPALGEYLRSTAPLTLGEASTNPQWGIGFALEDDNAIDKSKWNKQGNLLGRLLMKIRSQMINERQNHHAPPNRKKPSSQNGSVTNYNNGKKPSATTSASGQQPDKTSAVSPSENGSQLATPSNTQGRANTNTTSQK